MDVKIQSVKFDAGKQLVEFVEKKMSRLERFAEPPDGSRRHFASGQRPRKRQQGRSGDAACSGRRHSNRTARENIRRGGRPVARRHQTSDREAQGEIIPRTLRQTRATTENGRRVSLKSLGTLKSLRTFYLNAPPAPVRHRRSAPNRPERCATANRGHPHLYKYSRTPRTTSR